MKEGQGMSAFKAEHSERSHPMAEVSDPKYSHSQFSNPEQLKKSGDDLAKYVKKNRMQYP